MARKSQIVSNFIQLQEHDEQLLRLGMLAERYFPDDPNTCLLKLRQLCELLAKMIASNVGWYDSYDENQYELLRRLKYKAILPVEIHQLFDEVRRAGNKANHAIDGDHNLALSSLKLTWQIGNWFHRTFKNPNYKSGPFVPPKPPTDESEQLKEELSRLSKHLQEYESANKLTEQRLETVENQLQETQDEKSFWEQIASEAETAKVELENKLAEKQAEIASSSTNNLASIISAGHKAVEALHLDEAETRKLIDEQLRIAGWEADSVNVKYSKGTRPEKGKNLAIAEWPTDTGPADYVLFIGLKPMAIVEAKRKNADVSGALQQAKRYCKSFSVTEEMESHGNSWGEFKLPFVFSSNGRPYLKQLVTRSGIWFCDVRSPENLAKALYGWYTPERLKELLRQDIEKANKDLQKQSFSYGFTLRDYQINAITATESAIAEGKRKMLLAMATGTGKTKTCIALVYRLLKAQRFKRILFLVDRTSLGEQAANAFKDTRMESLQTFADIFGIKELDEQEPDTDTGVHIATVQGMVHRALYPSENSLAPTIDQYDCIVVDECHRGYLLDRELSDTELGFRSYNDYISKYRRVLDYFDAVKIGLTATPALHTTEIFGLPTFAYTYREAVIDGYLIDHEPPIQIETELSKEGINWKAGERLQVYDPRKNKIDLYEAPDDINLEVEHFNKKVITESFNRVVCEYLAKEIDPASNQKTLIFCATDSHADLVVKLLKEAFVKVYGSVEDDAVIKITGAADKPLQLIRLYKNERLPNVAVTVDLLTTGIDVPEICNLVFLRRVSSRILFDQMLGRATRLCDDVDKEAFRVFDAVRIYEALKDLTDMEPVVVNPKISFTQLIEEIIGVDDEDAKKLARDQFVAKFQSKKRHLSDKARENFETVAGVAPDQFVKEIKNIPIDELASWFVANPELGELLDRKNEGRVNPIFVSDHADKLLSVERGYGRAVKPEDYIKEFSDFIVSNRNSIPALITVLTRPRELTRKQLRELALELDKAGFSETTLTTAWREMTNKDIAARIVGFIRQAAIGDPLLSYEQRVDNALQKMLASRSWSAPQRQWLQRIAAQTTANVIVDREALDDPNMLFKREGGGFDRLNRIFEGKLLEILTEFNGSLWQSAG